MKLSRQTLLARQEALNRISQSTDLRTALKEGIARLRDGHVPSHTLAAELLLMHVLGRGRAWLYSHPEAPVDPAIAERYFGLISQRVAGTPTQYLVGQQEFWGLEFEVTPSVLIPRPETEHVVEVALERLRQNRELNAELRVADVGTGSGCLAVALAHELPGTRVVATDISPLALEVACRNAARHGLGSRIEFVPCNLLDVFLHESQTTNHGSQPFDLIVSNPPYVSRGEAGSLPREVREHEPAEALFAGEHGLEIYQPLIQQAEKLLVPRGILVLELGYNAAARVRSLLDPAAWTNVDITNDLAGIPRVLAATRL